MIGDRKRVLSASSPLPRPLSDEDHPGKADKRVRTFKILAKQKSFYLRAASVPLKEQWLQAIQDCARYMLVFMYECAALYNTHRPLVQISGHSLDCFSPLCAAYSLSHSSLQIQESGAIRDAAQTAPIYVSSESNCQICAKVFTFFVRKNHCHNWCVNSCLPCYRCW